MPPFPSETPIYDKPYVAADADSKTHPAKASPDLTARWQFPGGSFHLEAQLIADDKNEIDSKPSLIPDAPEGKKSPSLQFDGRQRLRVGPVDMEGWKDLTVSAWIKTTSNAGAMRIVSKDRIGQPGNFMLRTGGPGVWTMQAWDSRASTWRSAAWRSDEVSDGEWHHLTGIVSSEKKKVLLIIDGEVRAEAPWTAGTLDDSDSADIVVGADSGDKKFGHCYEGLVHDVRIYATPERISARKPTTSPSSKKAVARPGLEPQIILPPEFNPNGESDWVKMFEKHQAPKL